MPTNPDEMTDEQLADWMATDEAAAWLIANDRVVRSEATEAIRSARIANEQAEAALVAAVRDGRASGTSWATIGTLLGMSRQGAQSYFAPRLQSPAAER